MLLSPNANRIQLLSNVYYIAFIKAAEFKVTLISFNTGSGYRIQENFNLLSNITSN